MRHPLGELFGVQAEIMKQTVGMWRRVTEIYARYLPGIVAASLVPIPVQTRRPTARPRCGDSRR